MCYCRVDLRVRLIGCASGCCCDAPVVCATGWSTTSANFAQSLEMDVSAHRQNVHVGPLMKCQSHLVRCLLIDASSPFFTLLSAFYWELCCGARNKSNIARHPNNLITRDKRLDPALRVCKNFGLSSKFELYTAYRRRKYAHIELTSEKLVPFLARRHIMAKEITYGRSRIQTFVRIHPRVWCTNLSKLCHHTICPILDHRLS